MRKDVLTDLIFSFLRAHCCELLPVLRRRQPIQALERFLKLRPVRIMELRADLGNRHATLNEEFAPIVQSRPPPSGTKIHSGTQREDMTEPSFAAPRQLRCLRGRQIPAARL